MRPEEIAAKLTPIQVHTLLLAEADNRNPIRGKLWLQKEMFLVSRAVPELASELGYEPSLKGPMSEALEVLRAGTAEIVPEAGLEEKLAPGRE